jgi:hypothetical protein
MTSIGLPACGLPSAEFQSGNTVGHGNQLGIAVHPEHRFTKDKEPVGTLPVFSVRYVSPNVTRSLCDTSLKRTFLIAYTGVNEVPEGWCGKTGTVTSASREVFGGILEREGDEITKEPRKLHNDYFRDFFFLWRCDPTRVMATSFMRFSSSHTTTHHSR